MLIFWPTLWRRVVVRVHIFYLHYCDGDLNKCVKLELFMAFSLSLQLAAVHVWWNYS